MHIKLALRSVENNETYQIAFTKFQKSGDL